MVLQKVLPLQSGCALPVAVAMEFAWDRFVAVVETLYSVDGRVGKFKIAISFLGSLSGHAPKPLNRNRTSTVGPLGAF